MNSKNLNIFLLHKNTNGILWPPSLNEFLRHDISIRLTQTITCDRIDVKCTSSSIKKTLSPLLKYENQ